jgi:hypothetical protein
MKPGAFKLWVNWIPNLYMPPTVEGDRRHGGVRRRRVQRQGVALGQGGERGGELGGGPSVGRVVGDFS